MKRDPLYIQIKNYMYEYILNSADHVHKKLPSESRISIQFNVSRITSKRVLEDLKEEGFIERRKGYGSFIRDDFDRKKLEEKIKNTTYKRKLSKGSTKNIGLILPGFKSSYMMDIFNGVYEALEGTEYHIILASSKYDTELEKILIKKIVSKVDGLIIFPLNNSDFSTELLKVSMYDFPLVLVDNNLQGISATYIMNNNFQSAFNATNSMISNGKRKIAIFSTNPTGNTSTKDRIDGFKTALRLNSIPFEPQLALINLSPSKKNWETEIFLLLKNNINIQGIFCTDFSIGITVIKILKQFNIEINKDVDFVMFGNEMETYSDTFDNKPHFIKQNPFEMGQQAGNAILAQIESGELLKNNIIIVNNEKLF